MRTAHLRRWALAGSLAVISLRCSDNSTQPPTASELEKVGGDGQTGTVGEALGSPLVVRVLDQSGNGVGGVSVHWDANGSGSVSAATVETGSDGRASVQRVLGSEPGEQSTTAEVSGLTGSPVTFVSTATDGESPVLAVVTQPSNTAETGVALAVQPVIQLRDAEGNAQEEAGVEVTASIVGETGTLGGTTTESTDGSGTATFTDLSITGPAGTYTLRFTAPGTTQALSAPITLSGGTSGASIAITTNPPVSALDGEVFDPSVQPVVEVTGASGDPAAGVEVTATVSGSGALEGTTTATTDDEGSAQFADLGIRGPGTYTLEFTAGSASVTSSPVEIEALPTQASKGEWGGVVNWDIIPLHMNLMPNGRILAWGKTDAADTMGMPRLWNPAAGPPSSAQMIMVDTMLFCAGHALLPDGRLMSSGGHLRDDFGIAVTRFFTDDGGWTKGPDMAYGRWYPTVTVLGDGRVLTMGGRDEQGAVVKIPEIWENNQWVELPGASAVEIPYYPRNFVDPKDGRIFYAGERIVSRWFSVDGSTSGNRGRWTTGPRHVWDFNRDYGTAAMYEPGKIIYAGGGGHTGWGQSPDPDNAQPTATAEVIDLNDATPAWRNTSPMSVPRRHLNSTILPDGQVLVTGGTSGAGFVNISEGLAAKEAEVWNPETGEWTTLAPNSEMRVYHSVSLLLPDGRVLHGASGDAMAVQPGGGIVEVPPERNHEIFSPPYLFRGARPTITSAPTSVGYGETFTLDTPNAGQITDARWIRLGSVTHAFDMGQRANTLSFTSTATGVDITAPADPNLAPPGYYMVFILNRNGVPSEGRIVQVR